MIDLVHSVATTVTTGFGTKWERPEARERRDAGAFGGTRDSTREDISRAVGRSDGFRLQHISINTRRCLVSCGGPKTTSSMSGLHARDMKERI